MFFGNRRRSVEGEMVQPPNNISFIRNIDVIPVLSKIEQFQAIVQRIKEIFKFICSNQIFTLYWIGKNKDYLIGKIPLPFAKSIKIEEIEEKFDFFSFIPNGQKFTDYKSLRRYINRVMKKGTCYGNCITLLQIILSNPNRPADEMLMFLSKQTDRVAYFQMIEICRDYFENSSVSNLENSYILKKLLPEINLTRIFSFAKKKDSWKQFLNYFQTCNNCVLLMRCWNERKNKSHAILVYKSNTFNQYWFFNSAMLGLYNFLENTTLLEHLSDHLKKCMLYALEDQGFIMIEQYKIR